MYPEKVVVVQDNDLINTPYILTLNEKRLMMLVVSKINPLELPKPNETFEAIITTAEWRERFNLTHSTAYRELYMACETLGDRDALRIPVEGGKPAIAPWISYGEPDPEERRVTITLVYKLMIFLQGFVDQFTQYDLHNVRDLNSFYSIRIYELLCQYKSIGKRCFKLDDFRGLIDPHNKYKRWPDMRRFIIQRAVDDINAETDLHVTWRQTNPGRRVTDIEFSINKQKDNSHLSVV